MRLFCIIAALVAQAAQAICIREYFAQPVIYDKAMNIDFYYTGINMATVTACAEFCADRHFCRTAVFNSFTKTCAISYEYTLNCRYNPSRYKEFPVDQASSHLIQIACIEKCNEKSKNVALDAPPLPTLLTAEPFDSLPKTLKKVELITGKPDEAASTDYVELARARDVPRKDKAEEGFLNHLIIENVTGGVLAAHDPVNKQVAGGSKICYREIPQKYLLGGSFERHDKKTIQECRCLCAETYSSGNLHICQSFQWYTSGVCVLNKGNHLGKFDLIKDKYATYQYVDCDEEVLLDIAAKVCGKGQTIRAPVLRSPIQESKKETFKLPVLAPSPFDPITGQIKKNYESIVKETTTRPIETETQPSVGTSTPIVSTSSQNPSTTTQSTTTTTITTSTTETAATPEDRLIEASGEQPEETNERLNEIESNVVLSRETSHEAQSGGDSTSAGSSQAKLPITSTNGGCFEQIDGYMMVNVAGGLEHDVSIEECRCICANSLKSGRYSFECASATYYHNERDCILNLENRNENENLFEKQFEDYSVTYIGLTCLRDEALKQVVNPAYEYGCKAETSRIPLSSVNAVKPSVEDKSDNCYKEMPFYILEGTAQQIETGISLQQCKCLCTQSEHRYGEPCQSFQYYFESQTCLLSKDNRFSNPENFNFVQTSQKRSYFELICATDESQLKRYTAKECQIDDALRNELIRESENEIFFVDKSTTTEVPTTEFLTSEGSTTETPTSTVLESIIPVTEKKLKIDAETNLGDVEKVDSSTEIARNAVRKVSAEVGEDEDQEERLNSVSPPVEKTTSEKQETVQQTFEKSKTNEENAETEDEADNEKLVAESPDAAGIASDAPTNLENLQEEDEQSTERSVESEESDEAENENSENQKEAQDDDEVEKPLTDSDEQTDDSEKDAITRQETLQNIKKKKLKEDHKKSEIKSKKAKKAIIKKLKEKSEDEEEGSKKEKSDSEETAEASVSEVPATDDDVDSSDSTATDLSTTVTNPAGDNVTSSVTITTTAQPKRTHKPEVRKKKVFINRRIPETEGLREKDFEYDEVQVEMSAESEATTIHTTAPVEKKHKNIPLNDDQLPEKNAKLMDILKKVHGVKTRKFTEKSQKTRELEVPAITTTTEALETSTFITTTTATYPKFDKCTYSALYQTAFQGRRLLKAVHVKTASDCFAACYALRCRSANLISQGDINQCELYKDSLIDYRRPDMIGFEGSSVYFDGIRCEA